MIFRHSMLNLKRSRGKTAAFFALLLALTALLSLSIGVWASVSGFLRDAKNDYRTVGVFEYMSPSYQGEDVCDPDARAAADALSALDICSAPGALGWDAAETALGSITGYSRSDFSVPLPDSAVLIVRDPFPDKNGLYWCSVEKTLYAKEDCTELRIFLDTPDGTVLESGHYYAVCGKFYSGLSSYKYFLASGIENDAAELGGYDLPSPCTDVTAADGSWSLSDDSAYYDAAETLRVINNSVDVHSTSDVLSLPVFQQLKQYVAEGRSFTEQEYAEGASVCLIPQAAADALGVGVGDSIALSLAVTEGASASGSYWAAGGFAYSGDYAVVGILNDLSGASPCVYIPKSDAMSLAGPDGSVLGTAHVDNDAAAEFCASLSGALPERVRLTMYDQGYAGVAESFGYIKRIAVLTTLACALVCLAVLGMFGYLYVYRQRDVSQTMIRLGAGRRRVREYFACGGGVLSGAAAIFGAAAGWAVSGKVGDAVARFAAEHTPVDTRYSNTALTVTRSADFTMDTAPGFYLAVAAAVTVLAVGFCLIFTSRTFAGMGDRRPSAGKGGAKSVSLRGGAAKYALLSAMRGGARTAIAPALALTAAILFTSLSASSAAYGDRLEDIYASSQVTCAMTDSAGKLGSSALMSGDKLNELMTTGMVENVCATRSAYMYFIGVASRQGEALEVPSFEDVLPENSFSAETFLDNVERGARFVFTNDLESSPQFRYSGGVVTEWMDGCDESCLAGSEDTGFVVSTDFMEENNIEFGDVIRVFFYTGRDNRSLSGTMEAPVVGSYVKQGDLDNIYFPLSAYMDISALPISADEDETRQLRSYAFDSVSFTLSDASQLWDFKQQLEELGFAQVGSLRGGRTYLVLDDQSLLTLVGKLKQQMRFSDMLYPLLYALALLCGFLSAFLLTRSRQREIAIMRAIGASKARSFGCVFWELAALTAIGAGAGLLLRWGSPPLGAVLTGAYVAVSFIGSALALALMNRGIALAMLHEEE